MSLTRRSWMICGAAAVAACGFGAGAGPGFGDDEAKPVKVLIITGDHGHDWKTTTRVLQEILSTPKGRFQVDATTTPSKDLTPEKLQAYDVLLLNYRDTNKGTPETNWTDANKKAFLDAVKSGKGLVVYHHTSSAFVNPNWDEFEKAIGGGWRKQGHHGPKHVFKVKTASTAHPISEGLPSEFTHALDELYANSVMVEGNVVLATAYSDPAKPKGTGKDEPIVWINQYGNGRVYHNVLGHDAEAMASPAFQSWIRRGVEWAGTGKVSPDTK